MAAPATRAVGARVAEMFERHSRMVYALCRVLLRDTNEADDATQQTFLSAYRSLLRGSEPRHAASWLATIARHECVKRARRRVPEPVSLDELESAGDGDLANLAGQREEIRALREAVRDLPREQREAFILREFYGLSYREIAAAMGRSGAAVETMLFRSRRRLQAQLGPVRAAIMVFAVPSVVRDFLCNSVPGFWGASVSGSAATSAAAGGAVLAKLGSTPFAAKIVATVVAVGAAGTLTVERRHHAPRAHIRAAVAHPSRSVHARKSRSRAAVHPVPATHTTAAATRVRTSSPTTAPPTRPATYAAAESASADERASGSGGHTTPIEKRSELVDGPDVAAAVMEAVVSAQPPVAPAPPTSSEPGSPSSTGEDTSAPGTGPSSGSTSEDTHYSGTEHETSGTETSRDR